ncbi:MAG: DeoR/GlpR family DNA-binding transcription regulator [Bacteroidales bacterium]
MSSTIAERHQHILNKLKEQGHVSVFNLSRELQVSTVTIRKDLKNLEEKKLLFRTHGSATPNNPYINDRPVDEKEKIRVFQKQRIARYGSGLIEPKDSILLASGTTLIELARQIKVSDQLTVVTASLNIALILSRNPLIDIIQLGGMVRKSSSSIIGPYAENMLNNFSCTKLFMGVDGIDADHGLTTTNALEATLNQQMIRSAQRVIVLADSSKFGRRGFSRICGLSEIDIIITDNEASPAFVKNLEEAGIEVVIR